ncbi:MAG: lytic transglycosylase domain-containing protein [Bryobacterales bacterium]|nr:lytic transglycosylase domain-containing protein [Bryobacterales bacterium]
MRFITPLLILSTATLWGQVTAHDWADHWADIYGLPRELVDAVIEAESGWNPSAISPAGAVGLMQLMPDTAVTFGVRNRFDIAENTRGGVAYLAWLKERCGGDWRLIVASYNAGHARVLRWGLGYASIEVHAHVSRVAHLYRRNRWETLLRAERSTS